MDLLHRDEEQAAREYDTQLHNGNPKLTPEQIKPIVEAYREQMKLIQALGSLPPEDALEFARGPGIPSGRRLFQGDRGGCRLSALGPHRAPIPRLRFKRFDPQTSKSRSRRMGSGESGGFGSSRVAAGAALKRCGFPSTDHSHSRLAG